MSMVCMMHRGMSPWFRAKIMACSRVTFRVHLQIPKKRKGEPHADADVNSGGGGERYGGLTCACRWHTWWCDRLPGGCTARRTRTERWPPMGGPGCWGARWRTTAWVGKGRPTWSGVAATTKVRQLRVWGRVPKSFQRPLGARLYFNYNLLHNCLSLMTVKITINDKVAPC